MADPTISWHADGNDWIGGVAELPRVLLLIEAAPWSKCRLRVYSRSAIQHDRMCRDVDEAKEAAKVVCRLLAIRETA